MSLSSLLPIINPMNVSKPSSNGMGTNTYGDTIQLAYKDKNGQVQYKTIKSSEGIINRYYEAIGQNNSELKEIPDNNRVTKFESLESKDTTDLRKPTRSDASYTAADHTITQSLTKYKGSEEKSYPKYIGKNMSSGRKLYDYTITIQSEMMGDIKRIKRNMNIPSAYNRLELNEKFHTEFNRFRIQYPDYFLNNTVGFVAFTRPDLNIMNKEGKFTSQVTNDAQLYYIAQASPETARLLTKDYSSRHYFNPLLTNTVMSLDVSDESIDTLETGETFTGFKTQYAKSNIRSMTAGTISVTFPETYNMGITHAHQIWCAYESGVYRGALKPKKKYIWGKELDYACDIYYFLLDVDDYIIRYWCKYTGCFPLNVNKSIYSYSGETQINHPSLNVTYAYFAREDLSLMNLVEFNNASKANDNGFKYKANYVSELGTCGKTWSGPPFVAKVKRGTGFNKDAVLYALRFSPSVE